MQGLTPAALLTALLLAWGGVTATATAEVPAPARPFLVVVDRQTWSDAALRERVGRYLDHVDHLFAHTARVVQVEACDPQAPGRDLAAVRAHLVAAHRDDGIVGAILLGRIPFMVWRQAAGGNWVNFGTEDFYFADLDATFLDAESRHGDRNGDGRIVGAVTNSLANHLVAGREREPDGQYDTYLRGPGEGPELWVARLFATNAAQYVAYFDKVNAYYEAIRRQLDADPGGTVTPFSGILYTGHPDFVPHPDAAKFRFFADFCRARTGSTFQVVGERTGGTVPAYFSNLNTRAWLYASADGHADMQVHTLKGGSYSAAELRSRIEPGRGALIQQIWGCHGNDFRCNTDGALNLCQAYVMSPGACQASYGSSWTSGTEETEVDLLQGLARGEYLGEAFRSMQRRLYAKEHERTFFASELRHTNWFTPQDAPDEERMDVLVTKLLRGYNLMGNPFLKLTYTRPAR